MDRPAFTRKDPNGTDGPTPDEAQVPPEWETLSLDLSGSLMVVGGPDTGKSTFSSFLYRRLHAAAPTTALLDADPGQGRLGPPATTALHRPGGGGDRLFFMGSSSPSGHMLPLLAGVAAMIREAYESGAKTLVCDTTGLIDPAAGGLRLKRAKIALLRPSHLFAFQHGDELEPLLQPLRAGGRVRVVDLRPPEAVRPRTREERRARRAERFARYFRRAGSLQVDGSALPVFPAPRFDPNRLLALEDAEGFALGLGIVQAASEDGRSLQLLTPVPALEGVNALTLGDLTVEPHTFFDTHAPLRQVGIR